MLVKNHIRELRHAAGITQLKFAKDLRITRQTVIAIETGKYNPSLELAFKISRYFGKTLEEIFRFEEDTNE